MNESLWDVSLPSLLSPYLSIEKRTCKENAETLNKTLTVLCELEVDKWTIVLIYFLCLRRHSSLGTFKENKFMLAHASVQGQGATSGGSCLASSVLRPCEHYVAKWRMSMCLSKNHSKD